MRAERGLPEPVALVRMRRRAVRIAAIIAPSFAAILVVVAAISGLASLRTWAAVCVVVAGVSLVQMAAGSDDLRILAVSVSVAVLGASAIAPSVTVPPAVVGSGVGVTFIVALMGWRRGTVAAWMVAISLHVLALWVADIEPAAAVTSMTTLGSVGAVAWVINRRVVAELVGGEDSYRRLFDRVPVGLYRTGLSGELLDANPALADLVGYERNEVIGVNARDLLFDPEDLDRLRAQLGEGADALTTDIRFIRSDGEVIWVRDRTRPVLDERGKAVYFEGELQDVTEERRHLEELETLVRSKSELIGAVSHELRTPLTAVVGFLDVLRDRMQSGTEEERELLALAVEQAHEVAGIVEDLLTAARIDNRELVIHCDEFDVPEAVQGAARSLGGADMVHLTTDVPAGLVAYGDAARVRQILRNLIGNAMRHGEPPIRIVAFTADDEVCIMVADRGDSIPADVAAHMFDAYYSGAAAAGQPGSIGLGLSVSHRLAHLMGGRLEHHRVGDETRFVLRLPTKVRPVEMVRGSSSRTPTE